MPPQIVPYGVTTPVIVYHSRSSRPNHLVAEPERNGHIVDQHRKIVDTNAHFVPTPLRQNTTGADMRRVCTYRWNPGSAPRNSQKPGRWMRHADSVGSLHHRHHTSKDTSSTFVQADRSPSARSIGKIISGNTCGNFIAASKCPVLTFVDPSQTMRGVAVGFEV